MWERRSRMYNIIRSVNYTLRRDILVLVTIFAMITLPVIVLFAGNDYSVHEMTGSLYFATMEDIYIVFLIAILILASKCCAADAADKTINYELMSGHRRASVYWSRIIVGFVWSVLIVSVCYMLPIGYMTLANGLGNSVAISDMVLRLSLIGLVTFRIAAFIMMIATILRSPGKSIALGYIMIMVVSMFSMFSEDSFEEGNWANYLSGLAKVLELANFKEVGEKIFDASLSGTIVVCTVVSSLVCITVYLVIGCVAFVRKDRD